MSSNYVNYQLDPMGQPRFYGVYRGKVVENQDPLGKRRVRLRVPALFGNDTTNWAEACLSPVIEREHGTDGTKVATTSTEFETTEFEHDHTVTMKKHKKVPNVGTKVWVMFEAGNPDFPVWIGVRG